MNDKKELPKIIISETTWEEIVRQVMDGEIKDFKFLNFIDEDADNYYKKIL